MWFITLIVCMLNYFYRPRMNPIRSWCIIFSMYYCIWFATVLVRICASIFVLVYGYRFYLMWSWANASFVHLPLLFLYPSPLHSGLFYDLHEIIGCNGADYFYFHIMTQGHNYSSFLLFLHSGSHRKYLKQDSWLLFIPL